MPTYPLTYLVCPECEQIHYFRAVPIKEGTLIRYNHPQDPDDPTNFNTDCLTYHAMQENDQPTLTRALDHTRANPLHAEAMTTVDELTKTDLVTAVLACPQCGETSLFNTNWHRELTAFWSFGTARLTALLENGEHDRWRLLMKGDPSCGFCERLKNNEPDALAEAVAYTNQNFPPHQRRSPDPLAVHQPADPSALHAAATFAAGQWHGLSTGPRSE